MGIAFDPPTFEDLFRNFVKVCTHTYNPNRYVITYMIFMFQSIPICILFCVGANDFDENESK